MRNLHQVGLTTATFFVLLSIAPLASAQSSAPEEPPPTFGEISNKPTATPPASPAAPSSGTAEAPSTNAPAAADGSAVPAAAPPASPATPAAPTATAWPPAAPPTECKEAWLRDGFYLRIMSGGGFATFRGNGPSGSTSVSGVSSNSIIAIGGSIAPRLVLAATVQATSVNGEFKGGPFADATIIAIGGNADSTEAKTPTKSATAALSQIGAMVDWYPSSALGAHLGLSVGLGTTAVVNQADDSSYSGMSGAATVLVGYDWPISRAWALGLALVATSSTKTSLNHTKSGHDAGYDLTPFSIGLTTSVLYF